MKQIKNRSSCATFWPETNREQSGRRHATKGNSIRCEVPSKDLNREVHIEWKVQKLGRQFREEKVNHVEKSERCRRLRWVELGLWIWNTETLHRIQSGKPAGQLPLWSRKEEDERCFVIGISCEGWRWMDLRIATSGVYDISDINLSGSLLREVVKNRQIISEAVNNSLLFRNRMRVRLFYPLRQGWPTGGPRGKHMRPLVT